MARSPGSDDKPERLDPESSITAYATIGSFFFNFVCVGVSVCLSVLSLQLIYKEAEFLKLWLPGAPAITP